MATFNEQGIIRFQGSVPSVSGETRPPQASPSLGVSPRPSGRRANSSSRRESRHNSRSEVAPGEQAQKAVLLESKPSTTSSPPTVKPSATSQKRLVDTSPEAAVSRLLHAMALKEAATARLIHVEVEKAERAAAQTVGALSVDDVLALHRSAADMVYAIAHKEELFVSKLTVLLGIVETMAGARSGLCDPELD